MIHPIRVSNTNRLALKAAVMTASSTVKAPRLKSRIPTTMTTMDAKIINSPFLLVFGHKKTP